MSPTDRSIHSTWLPALAVLTLVWSLLPGLLPLFQLQAEDWNWAFAWQGLRFAVDDLPVTALFGAICTGFLFQAWFATARPRASHILAFGIYVGLALAYLGLALARNLAAPLAASDALSSSLIGLALGSVAGHAVARRFALLLPDVRSAQRIWPWLVATPFALALLPIASDASLTQIGFSAFMELPQRFYGLLKALIVWLPVGLLIALSGHGPSLRVWGIAGLATLPPVLNTSLLDLPWRDWMNLLAVLPGLAGGLWLVERGRFLPGADFDVVRAPASYAKEIAAPPLSALPPDTQTVRPVRSGPFAIASAGLLLVAALATLLNFPHWPLFLGIGLALYGGLLWRQPLAWLLVVPAALPVLDLAPWSGRFFLDEFDLLMAVTLAVLILRGRVQAALAWPPLARLVLATFFGLALVSGLIGLADWPAVDANAFSTYWSPYNALRVAKGFLWGAMLLFLVRRTCVDLDRFTHWLAIGMALGLLAVCLVGIWERWLYSGLADRDSSYRIVGLFSSMHTGGGHIEAYMAAALPFLWLGMRHWKSLLLAAPLLALATYVLIYTVARGGALAFGLIFVILAVGSVRLAWLAGNRRVQLGACRTLVVDSENRPRRARFLPASPPHSHSMGQEAGEKGAVAAGLQPTIPKSDRLLAPILVLAGAAAILIGGISGGYFQQRFSQTAEDTQTRLDHWSQTLAMTDDSWTTRLFGMGLGSFPRVFLARGEAEDRPATYGFVASRTGEALRLGTGATLYYAQRASIEAHTVYRLVLDARAEGGQARLETPLCEKQMLNSRRCIWSNIDVPGDGAWRRYERAIDSGEVGAGSMFSHLPTEFVLSNAGKAGLLEIDNVRLLDTAGRDLLCNGNFEAGADCWFFKTHSHLPWHIKNVWVHIVFEQGWLGLAAFLALTGLALARAAKAAWRGQPLAWVLLAAMVGMFSVGLFDSLLDAPRLAMLLLGFSLLAVAPPWAARKRSHKRRTAAKRATG